MSAGCKTDCWSEEKTSKEDSKSRTIPDKVLTLSDESGTIPLKVIAQKDGENVIVVKTDDIESPATEKKGFRESIQNIPRVHKFDQKKNKLIKQQTLSDLPEDHSEDKKAIKTLKKQNTISGTIVSEGHFSPCSVSSDGGRLFFRVRASVRDKDVSSSSVSSVVSLNGIGNLNADGTSENRASCTSYRPRSGIDFWSQVAQQVAFIDSTGHSNRSSLLLNCGHQIPPGVSNSIC